MLTAKQEEFCKNVASGLTYKESYIKAYNTKASEQVISNEASKLMLREDIQERIKAINKPLEKAVQIETFNARKNQIEEIKQRIEICKQKEDEASLIRYYDMLNKIYALYKESETEIKEENKVTKLDTSTLIKLADIG